jgi:hypothetical protein
VTKANPGDSSPLLGGTQEPNAKQDSASLKKGLAGHWVCTETDGRVLVSVTGCGVMPLARAFTEHEIYFLSKKGGVYNGLRPEGWYGSGAQRLSAEKEENRKKRRLEY